MAATMVVAMAMTMAARVQNPGARMFCQMYLALLTDVGSQCPRRGYGYGQTRSFALSDEWLDDLLPCVLK